ncbi:MAG: RHS repeat-associated core domain-containing protein, partial [Chloroflexi bacterium]|nr:RHS repeat-associated core domain-containing protein [Chloroflexota bacterium]
LLEDGTRKYVWGQGLAYAVDSLGTVEVQHADGLGSVRALTDGTAQVVQTYQSDEFGVQTQSQGTRSQPFEYTGEQRDAETGFVYLRARVYDPQMGRFLQRDTVAKAGPGISGWNRYAYAGNNPVNLTDPGGLDPWEDFKNCLDLQSPLFCLFPRLQPGPGGTVVAAADPVKDINPFGGDEVAGGGRAASNEIRASSRRVGEALKELERGATSVRVATRDEAAEVFMRRYQGHGYRNTTGFKFERWEDFDNFWGGKRGTYHWDEELDATGRVSGHGTENIHGQSSHLQIHTFEGDVVRIFFDP